ncbi:MAG TPA: ABC transporter substrate-binding protein [Candidatus Binatia bacterium]|nr:ABC transporter substrate-binding protein [Candidatus Binatia bacterium]
MRKKIFCLALGAMLSALSFSVEAQRTGKIPRIGYLSSLSASSDSSRKDAFRQGLKELGYVEEKNVAIEYEFAQGKLDRLPDLAGELVRLKVDVIVVGGSTATRAAKNATKLIPIVMINVTDPVVLGFVVSLARPGGNITGLSNLAPELGGKRLELLKEIVPQLSRVAVLGDPNSPAYGPQLNELKLAARALGLQLQPVEVRGPGDLENAFSAMIKAHAGAFMGLQQPTIDILRERIIDLAGKNRLPAMYPNRENVEAGGLISYAADISTMFRRAATYVDKILKGTKPADLPVEQPMKFELVINLKAAKQIGLTIPQWTLMKADRVIR